MRPDKQKQMMSYLTRPAKELIETGQVKFASDMVNPDPRKDVIEIDAINSFIKRNPRADGGMLVQPSNDGSRPGYNGKENRGGARPNTGGDRSEFIDYEIRIKNPGK